MARLNQQGVRIKGSIVRDTPGNFAHLEDPDGNELYFGEVPDYRAPKSELAGAGVRA